MSTVTYKAQPAVEKTKGNTPLTGTKYLYRVAKQLWPREVENYIAGQIVGRSLHVCCGWSELGDVRVDIDPAVKPDIVADAAHLTMIGDRSFDTVICDPPYTGVFRWMHDTLNELHRVANKRIIFQHHFSPVDQNGQFKKCHAFRIVETASVRVLPNSHGLVAAVLDGDKAIVVEQDETSDAYVLSDLLRWQPRTYFGRVQLISIMDRTT